MLRNFPSTSLPAIQGSSTGAGFDISCLGSTNERREKPTNGRRGEANIKQQKSHGQLQLGAIGDLTEATVEEVAKP